MSGRQSADAPLAGAALGDLSGLSEAELVDAIRAREDAKARASAEQARLTRELDARVRERHAAQGVPAARRGRDVAGLVAFARRESPARGQRFLGFARSLRELPHTAAAMDAGVLSEWRAMLVARETACLAAPERAVVDQRICARRPDGTYAFDGWGDRQLVAETTRQVAAIDPAALVERRSRAEADRSVSLRPAPDVMARLSALLPAAQGVAVWATLTRIADQARATGDPRSRQQVMADTLVERITGQAAADQAPVTINLVISDQTLLGGGTEPAWLQGYGPLSAAAATDLAAAAVADARAALRRLYAVTRDRRAGRHGVRGPRLPPGPGPVPRAPRPDLPQRLLRCPGPPPRPRRGPRRRRPDQRPERPGRLRAVQPHQAGARLARQTDHRAARYAPRRPDAAPHRAHGGLHRSTSAHPESTSVDDRPRRTQSTRTGPEARVALSELIPARPGGPFGEHRRSALTQSRRGSDEQRG